MARFGKLGMLAGARSLAKRNAEKVHQGIDKVADAVRGRVGSKHSGKVDKGADLAKKVITGTSEDQRHPQESTPDRSDAAAHP